MPMKNILSVPTTANRIWEVNWILGMINYARQPILWKYTLAIQSYTLI